MKNINSYPNSRKRYSDDEIEFIMQSKDMYTIKEYSDILGRSPESLRQKFLALGIKAKKRPNFSEDGTKKYCTRCKEFLPLDSFKERVVRGKKALRSMCNICEYNYNLDLKLAKKDKPPTKPTFQEILSYEKKIKCYCSSCKTKLTEENSLIVWSSRKNSYILGYKCKDCVNKNSKNHRLKLLLERGY